MTKMVMVVLVILLVFVGCKEDESSSLVEQNQPVGNVDVVDNIINQNNNMEDTNNEQNSDDKIVQNNQGTEHKSESYPLIKDNIHKLDNAVLKEIVQSYFLVFEFDMCFYEEDFVTFERSFQYMAGAGTYPIQPFEYWILFENYYDSDSGNYTIPVKVVDKLILEEKINSARFTNLTIIDNDYIIEPSDRYMRWSMRPELYQYFDKETEMIKVPTNIVDEYIVSKFNTSIDYSQIKEYDKESDTYIYYPFMGEFYYDISIDEVVIDGEIVKFTSILTNNVDDNLNSIYQATFVIKFVDGEYKFLSVDIKESSI
jgi:uncharacterized protein YcfL